MLYKYLIDNLTRICAMLKPLCLERMVAGPKMYQTFELVNLVRAFSFISLIY